MVSKIIDNKVPEEMRLASTIPKGSIIRQLYLHQLGVLPKVEWRSLIMKNSARPKSIFTLWLQLQNKLLTADRLLKWKLQVDSKCVMCKTEAETCSHLFQECVFAKEVLRRLCKWLQTSYNPPQPGDHYLPWAHQEDKREDKSGLHLQVCLCRIYLCHLVGEECSSVQERNKKCRMPSQRDQLHMQHQSSGQVEACISGAQVLSNLESRRHV